MGNPVRKLVLMHLADSASVENDWQSWYSLSRIAERCDCSRGAVRNQLKALVDLGYITLVEASTRQGKSARYRLNVGTVEIHLLHPGGAPDTQGGPSGIQGGTPDAQVGGTRDKQPGTSREQGGTRDVPKTKGTSNETKNGRFSIVKELEERYGYSPAQFSEPENAIINRWEFEQVTQAELEYAHEIGFNKKGNKPPLGYLKGIITNWRNQSQEKPKAANRNQQIESTDVLGANTQAYEDQHLQKMQKMIEDQKRQLEGASN